MQTLRSSSVSVLTVPPAPFMGYPCAAYARRMIRMRIVAYLADSRHGDVGNGTRGRRVKQGGAGGGQARKKHAEPSSSTEPTCPGAHQMILRAEHFAVLLRARLVVVDEPVVNLYGFDSLLRRLLLFTRLLITLTIDT